jgi:hypothetical protein
MAMVCDCQCTVESHFIDISFFVVPGFDVERTDLTFTNALLRESGSGIVLAPPTHKDVVAVGQFYKQNGFV